MSLKIAEIKKQTDEQIITAHDAAAKNTQVGTQFYLDELARREQAKFLEEQRAVNQQMLKYTRWVTYMTIVVTVATLISLAISLFKK